MNTVRPRPYPQRGTGNYNAGNEGTNKDGHNGNAQDQQQQRQNQQVVARGRAQDIQQHAGAPRQAIYSPAQNAYSGTPNRQVYQVQTPPPMRINNQPHQMNAMQYQAAQAGYQPIARSLIPREDRERLNIPLGA